MADRAVRTFPKSARLWVIRGDLIQLGADSTPHTLEDALASYRRAVEIDPEFAEAWEAIGHYTEVVLGNEVAAREYFQQAAKARRT